MMGTLVHVQLYTFIYRKAVIRPQNMPKTATCGQNWSKLGYFKMTPQALRTYDEQLTIEKKRGYLIRFGHTKALLLKRK